VSTRVERQGYRVRGRQRGAGRAPSRATVHRALERNGMVVPQAQRHKRKYKQWQRETPMALWQLPRSGRGEALNMNKVANCVHPASDHYK
jgi:hypothetical protein